LGAKAEEEITNYTLAFGQSVPDRDIRAIAASASLELLVGELYPQIGNMRTLLHSLELA
jgi:hypothetical protein